MTAKDKAIEIVSKVYNNALVHYWEAVVIAKITVTELINECQNHFEAISEDRVKWWQEVLGELEKM